MTGIKSMPIPGTNEPWAVSGFVDDEVVRRVAAGPRWAMMPQDSMMPEDYAGWSPEPLSIGEAISPIFANGASRSANEISAKSRVDHCWWMAGFASATLVLVILIPAFSLGFESGKLKEQFLHSLPWNLKDGKSLSSIKIE